MATIFPSLIGGNLLCIEKSMRQVAPYCHGFHLDVMDNHFVANLTFGADTVNAIADATSKQIWVHLMVDDPINWCDTMNLAPNSIVSFHFESTSNHDDIIECIKEKKWIPSIAINPKTDAEKIFPLLNAIDHALVMSVEPGFSGQRFLNDSLEKVKAIKRYKGEVVIGMDGGINQENIADVVAAGAQDLAIASAIFAPNDPGQAIQSLQKKI